MRFIFKTDYAQDIKLAKHGGHVFWYSALMLVLMAAPWIATEYWLAQLTFILIYAVAGLGLMLLAGFTEVDAPFGVVRSGRGVVVPGVYVSDVFVSGCGGSGHGGQR